MTDLQMWQLITGFLSATFVIPVFQQPRWSNRQRALFTFAYCVVLGLVTAYLGGAFNGLHDVRAGVSSVLFTLITAIASYNGFAKPVGVAPAIENATSPPPAG